MSDRPLYYADRYPASAIYHYQVPSDKLPYPRYNVDHGHIRRLSKLDMDYSAKHCSPRKSNVDEVNSSKEDFPVQNFPD